MAQNIRIIGIDPGYAIVGWGVLDFDGYRFSVVDYGAVTTSADLHFESRLEVIWDELSAILERHKPQVMAVEQLFFTTNQKTVIAVAQARGTILLRAVKSGLAVAEYTPLQVKSGVVGYGKAEKKQVQYMVKTILRLDAVPKPDDTADALAIAICHGHTSRANPGLKKILTKR